jgi:pyridoxine 5-phosphate synthase
VTVLSVNVNKVAVLRNSRGGDEPRVTQAAEVAIAAGCGGITVHPRPDARHIRADDVRALAAIAHGRVEFNIEGNPFAPPRDGYPGLLALVAETRPQQVTLVPDGDGQLTSDHGFDPARDAARLAPHVAALRDLGARVSVFVDGGAQDLAALAAIGVARVELYTGPYAEAAAVGAADTVLAQHRATALAAQAAGMRVNAGHDLSQANLGAYVRGVPGVAEVSIGHALFGEALYAGLDATVRAYLAILAGANPGR